MRIAAIAAGLGLLSSLWAIGPAAAQFPDKPIKLMAPYAPGGNIDVTARLIGDKLKEVLGVTVVVENKAGASGMIGSADVARSAPDGYNLLVAANSMVAVPAIYGNAPYDWRTAFQPISHIQAAPSIFVVHPDSPIKSVADFVAAGRDGKLAVSLSGIGTTNHMTLELFAEATGTKYTNVQYRGGGAAVLDTIAGQVPAHVNQVNAVLGYIKAGKLRAIAVTSDKRVPQLPDVPTVKESGIKGLENYTYSTFVGLLGPAKLPPDVAAKLHAAILKVLSDPAVVARFAELGAETRASSPEELMAMLDKEERAVVPLIKKLGIKPE
jgi:tripartite-type tricarboxylate transporter receptor subunit TctC